MVKFAKIVIFLMAILLVGYYLFKNTQDFNENKRVNDKPSLTSVNNEQKVKIDGKEYAFSWFQVSNSGNLFLFPNFVEKYTLNEAINNYACKNLTNGGFYTETNSPIGLFISEVGKLGYESNNKLFNGYFTLTKNGTPTISRYYSEASIRIGLQAGPILIYNGVVQKLNLVNDKMARRNVIALSKEGEIYFIAIYDEKSVFIGPLLVNLPELINKIQNEIEVEFDSALNLDGGTASVFYSKDISLSELTPVGSFFCER
jgi:uncharacterized protein YigE (DUF2233 family)